MTTSLLSGLRGGAGGLKAGAGGYGGETQSCPMQNGMGGKWLVVRGPTSFQKVTCIINLGFFRYHFTLFECPRADNSGSMLLGSRSVADYSYFFFI